MLSSLKQTSLAIQRLTHFFSIGESMKRPAITDSVSDIFELDDSQPNPNNRGNGVGGRGIMASSHVHQAQHHGLSRQEQYLQHNCNPRHNNNINAMSIETDVWQNGNRVSYIFVTKIYIFFVKQKENCVHRKKKEFTCVIPPRSLSFLRKTELCWFFPLGNYSLGKKQAQGILIALDMLAKKHFNLKKSF